MTCSLCQEVGLADSAEISDVAWVVTESVAWSIEEEEEGWACFSVGILLGAVLFA
jgi:hypothetical protein